MRLGSIFLGVFLMCSLAVTGNEVGFDELFSLSSDRKAALKELIPGSEEYYYYHCIHYQNEGEYDKVYSMLDQWIKRYSYTTRVEEIRTRQALIDYERSQGKTLDFIRDRLTLRFDHQKQKVRVAPDVPTSLDPEKVSRTAFARLALDRYSDLSGFEDSGLDAIDRKALNPARRRHLLARLHRPDYPGLVRLIIEDLRHEGSGGFGSHRIHSQLTINQLDECLRMKPELLTMNSFFEVFIRKLHPSEFIDWENDPIEKKRYLDRLWAFVQRLPQAQNSLKAQILYHILDHERSQGKYDPDLFRQYLTLPKNSSYVNNSFLRSTENRYQANIRTNYSAFTLLAPVSDDEPLVRDYLEHFLVDATDFNQYVEWVDHAYLQHLFARIKILNSKPDMEKWFSMLPPETLSELREMVEIELLPTNPSVFEDDQEITLDLNLKNIEKLIVRIYHINTENYYKEKLEEISPSIDLDGLVANEEKVYNYSHPQMHRHRQIFKFPQLKTEGVYVIEFIGNGKSSRALVRRSGMTFTQRVSASGHLFQILDSKGNLINDAVIWIAGREFKPDQSGEIIVPFTTRPAYTKFVICRNGFATMASFDHMSENFVLDTGFYVDREQLLEGKTARFAVSPRLYLNDTPVDISLLEEPLLRIVITDREGISTSLEKRDLKFDNNREYVHEIRIPEKTVGISISLEGKVENLSQGKKVDVSSSETLSINGADLTDRIENILVSKTEGGFIAQLVGKTGEARPDVPINVEVKHREFKQAENFVLKTDSEGVIQLGPLPEIQRVSLSSHEGSTAVFSPPTDRRTWLPVIHARTGDQIMIPFMGSTTGAPSNVISVLQVLKGLYLESYSHQARFQPGFIVIDDLPEGEYEIYIKPEQRTITLRITQGKRVFRHLVTRDCRFETRPVKPLQIIGHEVKDSNLKIKLAHVTPSTRVHLVASRFLPPFSPMDALGSPAQKSLGYVFHPRAVSRYLSGRTIGDEYRYILERRFAEIYPGNLLRRPGLLLNPWSLRKTDTQVDHAALGDAWADSAPPRQAKSSAKRKDKASKADTAASLAEVNLDFLPSTSLFLDNLVPDEEGYVTINLKQFNARSFITVYAVNLQDAVQRNITLPSVSEDYKDLRMRRAFEAGKHYSQQKRVSALKSGQTFVMDDVSTGKFEVYDTLSAVYRLFSTLTSNANLAEFGFLMRWPEMKMEEKRTLYSKYSCHELNFFLYKKDPAFFSEVVKPYIADKRHKTFLDKWLLELDLTEYLRPWEFGRLNVVEKILLAKRIDERSAGIRGLIKNLYDLQPPDLEAFNMLFDTALKSSSLDTADKFGFSGAVNEVEVAKAQVEYPMEDASVMRLRSPMPPPPPMARARMSGPSGAMPTSPMPSVSFVSVADEMVDGFMLREEAQEMEHSGRKQKREEPQFYRSLDKTEEWVENNYYKLPIEQQLGELVVVNAFWNDYAAADPSVPFLSSNIGYASGEFTEMMFALSVLDLPFNAPDHKVSYQDAVMRFETAGNAVIFHREIKPCESPEKPQTILVSQNLFEKKDRYRYVDNERLDRFITEEFITFRVYGCRVAITNPTSSRKKVDVLLQIPNGSIPVKDGFFTRSLHVQLEPYSTRNIEYHFYFPAAGEFRLYPVQVAENGTVIAAADSFSLKVVEQPTIIDRTSWQYVSQNASNDEVLEFLKNNNVERLDLSLILFRLRDKKFFTSLVSLLDQKFVFNYDVWAYSVYHKDTEALKDFLPMTRLPEYVGSTLVSPVLVVDPITRHAYQHREYWPLVNARTFQLGRRRRILNSQFHSQYQLLLSDLRFRRQLSDADKMAVAYYMMLQDRISDALRFFEAVKEPEITSTIQYAYMSCWFAFSKGEPQKAVQIAEKYKDYPVDRWRVLFRDVIAQAAELKGGAYSVSDTEDRDQKQAALADRMPALDMRVEDRKIHLEYHNLESCTIKFYLMDLELLFSHNPFVQDVSGRFSTILPNQTLNVELDGSGNLVLDLPVDFRDRNAMIEVTGAGITRSTAYYPHSLSVRMMESFGQLQVGKAGDATPLPKVYVKVYAKMNDGSVVFYKDGYTDLRGRFDYASLSTDELDRVQAFSILIVSDENGSLVREAKPPKR